jgi:hypothetical protein
MRTLKSLLDGPAVERPSHPPDVKILEFASRYGGLEAFYNFDGSSGDREIVIVEHCEVWRYFARAMGALLRIAAAFYNGGSGSREDWLVISHTPLIMRDLTQKMEVGVTHPFSASDEEAWLHASYFAGKDADQTTVMFSHLMNILLGLARVRPWIIWSDRSKRLVNSSSQAAVTRHIVFSWRKRSSRGSARQRRMSGASASLSKHAAACP